MRDLPAARGLSLGEAPRVLGWGLLRMGLQPPLSFYLLDCCVPACRQGQEGVKDCLARGVTVAHQVLVLGVLVQIQTGQLASEI